MRLATASQEAFYQLLLQGELLRRQAAFPLQLRCSNATGQQVQLQGTPPEQDAATEEAAQSPPAEDGDSPRIAWTPEGAARTLLVSAAGGSLHGLLLAGILHRPQDDGARAGIARPSFLKKRKREMKIKTNKADNLYQRKTCLY